MMDPVLQILTWINELLWNITSVVAASLMLLYHHTLLIITDQLLLLAVKILLHYKPLVSKIETVAPIYAYSNIP